MSEVSNLDLFDMLYDMIAEGASKEDVVREFGGGSIYIPSYKTTHRNSEIAKDLKDGLSMKAIMKKYSLSRSRVHSIISELRQPCFDF